MKRFKLQLFFLFTFSFFFTSTAIGQIGQVKKYLPAIANVSADAYLVHMNSITNHQVNLPGKNYFLLCAIKGINENDLQFQEFARYIQKALRVKGYYRVDSISKAQILIRLAYGIGNPHTVVNTQTYTTSLGYSYYVGWTQIYVPPKTQKVTTSTTTYHRFIMLDAYDAKNKNIQLWKTVITSDGSNGDLRSAFPHLVAGAVNILGEETNGMVGWGSYYDSPEYLSLVRSPEKDASYPFTGKERLGVYVINPSYQYRYFFKSSQVFSNNGISAGVTVLAVRKNSVADHMGIKQYDIIVKINKKVIRDTNDFDEAIRNIKPGKKIKVYFNDWSPGTHVRHAEGTLN